MIRLKTGNHESNPQVLLNTSWLAVLDKGAGHIDRLARRVDRLSSGGPSKSLIVVASVCVARVPLQQNEVSYWSHTPYTSTPTRPSRP